MNAFMFNGFPMLSYMGCGTTSIIYRTSKNAETLQSRVMKISLLSTPNTKSIFPVWFRKKQIESMSLNEWIQTVVTHKIVQTTCPEIVADLECYFTEQHGEHLFGFMILTDCGDSLAEFFGNSKQIIQSVNVLIEKAISHGIFHKDLHLGNILLDEKGVCRFIDFGPQVDIYPLEEKDGLTLRYIETQKYLYTILKSRDYQSKL